MTAVHPVAAGELPAEVHETHIGVVVLLGERAYKIKKPVRTPFCDFTSTELRHTAIERELVLNRRLAPDVYLGTAELTGPECAEPVLVMRRMPDDRRLATLIRAGRNVSTDLRRIARAVAAFHAGAERGPEISAEGGRDALTRRWRANLDESEPFRGDPLPGPELDLVRRLTERFLDGRGPLFARRAAEERIVDGHGDLLADDVFCLDDGPRMLDCLDFDARLRYVDGLDDIAFLAMDIERLGAPAHARRLLAEYAEFAGDPAPASLSHHYVAYRAMVRAKVACLRYAQSGSRAGKQAAADAQAYQAIAAAHLRRGAPRLVLVGGLPGTGKSTLAGALADRMGAVLVASDRVRKERAGLDPTAPATAGFRCGIYDAAHTEAVYGELLRRAGRLLARGESVVLDASWTDARHRDAAAGLARTASVELVCLRCTVSAEVAAARIHARAAGATASVSDATPAVAAAMAGTADPWPEAVEIPTGLPLAACTDLAAAAWDDAAG